MRPTIFGKATVLSGVIAVGLAVAAAVGPAQACAPEAPPYWPSVVREGGPAIAIGRVLSITPLSAPVLYRHYETDVAVAVIERVESIQGTIPLASAFTAATDVRMRGTGPLTDAWCGRRMDLQVGELVLVLHSEAGEFIAWPKRFVSPSLVARMDRHN